MPTDAAPTNPAQRVSTCDACGGRLVAAARGPLPRRHRDCQPRLDQLIYQVRTAARLAHALGWRSIGFELDHVAATLIGPPP